MKEVFLQVKVVPNCQNTRLRVINNDEIIIEVNARADNNNANNELIKFLAKSIKIRKDQIQIIGGLKSRVKKIKITNINETDVNKLFETV